MDFKEKKVILSGATSGIGKAILDDLATAGCDVLALSRNAARLADVRDYPPSVRLINCDVRSEPSVVTFAVSVTDMVFPAELSV